MPGAGNPQNLNRYSYVRNNPIRYTDPTGHWIDEGCGCANTGKTKVTAPKVINGNRVGNSDGKGIFVPVSKPSNPDGGTPDKKGNSGGGVSQSTGGGTCGAGIYSPRCPGWHFYRTTNLVCPAHLHCTAAQMQDYLYRFAYPSQNPNSPVSNNAKNFVLVNGIIPLGQIQTEVDGLTITNITRPLHLMHDGQVERRAVQNSDGSWSIVTTGMGNNVQIPIAPASPSGSEYGPQVVYADFSSLNQDLGPGAFNDLDETMLNYIVENQ